MNKAECNKAKKKLGFDPLVERPGKLLSKNDLKLCFEIFKRKYGEKAKSSSWLNKNKYGWFVSQSITRFGKWTNFLKALGCESLYKKLKSKEELKRIWEEELYPRFGEKAKSSSWLINNEHRWFVNQAIRRFSKWSNFIKALGHESLLRKLKSEEELKQDWEKGLYPRFGERAKSCGWLYNNKHGRFVQQAVRRFGNWSVFIKTIGYKPLYRKFKSKEELIQTWEKELYPKFGEKAKNGEWLIRNKYCWFIRQAITRFGKWSNFIKEAGHEPLLRKPKSKEELKQIWKEELCSKFGEKAKNSRWLIRNEYYWFVAQSTKRFSKWTNFLKALEGHFEITVEKMEIY